MQSTIFSRWLPEPVWRIALEQEPARFGAAVAALQAAVGRAKADAGNPNAWATVLASPLLDDIKTCVAANCCAPTRRPGRSCAAQAACMHGRAHAGARAGGMRPWQLWDGVMPRHVVVLWQHARMVMHLRSHAHVSADAAARPACCRLGAQARVCQDCVSRAGRGRAGAHAAGRGAADQQGRGGAGACGLAPPQRQQHQRRLLCGQQ